MDKVAIVKRFHTLVDELGEAYTQLYVILGQLPIPLTIVRSQKDDPFAAIRGLSRAWELISIETISEDVAEQLQAMITDWLTGYELAVAVVNHGPAAWRVRGLEAALARFSVSAEHVDLHLERRPDAGGPGIQVTGED